jgi:hypothetical protein
MIPPSSPGAMSQIIQAGSSSPWTDISQVPSTLVDLIGVPDDSIPADTPNQHWTSREQLDLEREALQRLNSSDDLDPSLRAELESRDREYLRLAKSRNETENEIAKRLDEEKDRVGRELAEENARLAAAGARPIRKTMF